MVIIGLVIFIIISFAVAALTTDEIVEIQTHPCDTVLIPEDDPEGECAELYKEKIRSICKKEEPHLESEECLDLVLLEIADACVGLEESLDISSDVCFYKSLRDFIKKAENLELGV